MAGFMPLSFYLFNDFWSITIMSCIGMTGFMIFNAFQSAYLADLIKEDFISYMAIFSLITVIPGIIFQPLGGYISHSLACRYYS